jgi:hypothetical protein
MAMQLSGSLEISGSIIATQGITGSFSGNATSASYADTLGGLPSSSFAPAATFNTVSQSFATTSGSLSSRVSIVEGQDATTGSNTFTGVQYISEASNAVSFTSTASLYTDGGLRVAKDSFVSGTAYFNNIIVYGTSSIEYITSSQVDIGANIITVNTDTPAVRFGGLSVFDSGSTQLTGSMLWDSETNHWVYSNPSGSSYSGGMIMSGPRAASLGTEQGTTNNALMKGQGGDHITSSQMIDDGTTVRIPGNLQVTGSLIGASATFSGNVTSDDLILTAGTLFGAGNTGFSNRSSDTTLYLQMPATGFNITDNALNTRFILSSAGVATFTRSTLNFTLNPSYGGSNVYSQLQSTGDLTLASGGDNNRLYIVANGNMGFGATPAAWGVGANYTGYQFKNASLYVRTSSPELYLNNNAYYNGTNWKYLVTATAAKFELINNQFLFSNVASGTADANITWVDRLTISAEGNLLVSSGATIYNNSGALFIRSGTSGDLILGAGGSNDRMRITSDGNVLIAQTSAPTASAGTIMMLSNTIFFNYTSGVGSPYNQALRVDIVWNSWGDNNVAALIDIDFLAREFGNLGGVSFGRIYALSSGGATTFNNTINTANVTTANATLTASSPANFMLRLLFTPTNVKDYIGCFIRIPISGAGTGSSVASITASLV